MVNEADPSEVIEPTPEPEPTAPESTAPESTAPADGDLRTNADGIEEVFEGGQWIHTAKAVGNTAVVERGVLLTTDTPDQPGHVGVVGAAPVDPYTNLELVVDGGAGGTFHAHSIEPDGSFVTAIHIPAGDHTIELRHPGTGEVFATDTVTST